MIAISVTNTMIGFGRFSATNGTDNGVTNGTATASVAGASDPDGDGGGHIHLARGGQLMQALQQTIQSLGVSTPSTSGDSTGSETNTSLEAALRSFVQALFSAAHSENAGAVSAASGAPASTSGTGGRFSTGLSTLITQVSNGNAPSGLQDAFNTLATDLQSSGRAAGTSTALTLQSFLTTLQQNLGYDNTTGGTAAGSSVNALA